MSDLKLYSTSSLSDDSEWEDVKLTELAIRFNRAADHLQTISSKLDSNQLLHCYSLYKQATKGVCNTPKPGLFDFQNKQKWSAWKSLGDMPEETAMHEYVAAVKLYDPDWNENEEKKHEVFGPVFSTLPYIDEHINEEDKTAFDWVKENNLCKLKQCIQEKKFPINQQDDLKMTLLHWACDRGFISIVEMLLENNIDINAQDEEGQTALHYASSCGYPEIIKLLLKNGAKIVKDDNGLTPKDVIFDDEVSKLFPS